MTNATCNHLLDSIFFLEKNKAYDTLIRVLFLDCFFLFDLRTNMLVESFWNKVKEGPVLKEFYLKTVRE